MELPPLGFVGQYIPIPEIFHSFDGDLFRECLLCNEDLLDDGVPYIIEKTFKGDEVLLEYAVCVKCHSSMASEISADSLRRIDAHFEERVDMVDRRKRLVEVSTTDIAPWIEECVLTKKKRSESDIYQILAHCDGPDLVFSYWPIMIADEGVKGLQQLLSKKTRDILDGFVQTNFGMPPEYADLPREPVFLPL